MTGPGGGGGVGRGGTLIFSCKRRLGSFFLGSKFLISTFFRGFQKNKYFGHEDFADIFGGSSQNWTIFRGYFYVF